MNICYIVCALDAKIDFFPDEGDLVIAADKGYSTLVKNRVRVDAIIGDFDSYGKVPDGENVIIYPKEKDDTDSALSIEYAVSKGYKSIYVYGGIGGAIDHTIANISLIARYAKSGIKVVFIYNDTAIFGLHNEKATFDEKASGRISVFSYTDISHGVTERGLFYSLENARLENTVSLGVSNEFIGKKSEISVDDGTLVIVTSKENYKNHLTK